MPTEPNKPQMFNTDYEMMEALERDHRATQPAQPITLRKGDQFKLDTSYHTGRTYTVAGFAPNKWGQRQVIANYSDTPGDTVYFLESEIDFYNAVSELRMWNSSPEWIADDFGFADCKAPQNVTETQLAVTAAAIDRILEAK